MKKLLLAFILTAAMLTSCAAQTQYVTTTTKNGVVHFQNVSGRSIIMMVGTISLDGQPTGTNNYVHDFFFQSGWQNGDTMDLDTKEGDSAPVYNYAVHLTFIQFDDGSIWGDKAAAKDALAIRWGKLAYMRGLINAASSEAEFVAALNKKVAAGSPAEAAQNRIQGMRSRAGAATTIVKVKELLANANARANSGKF